MHMKKSKLVKPTVREERAIRAGIARDADTYELSRGEFRELKPVRRGRPKSPVHKVPVTVRLDPQVVDYFRTSGRGWQTRVNEAPADYVSRRTR
jgi:uncharacterized protein (DUF4415 family)